MVIIRASAIVLQKVFLCSRKCTRKSCRALTSVIVLQQVLRSLYQQVLLYLSKCYCVPASVIVYQQVLLYLSKCNCPLASVIVLLQVSWYLQQVLFLPQQVLCKCYCALASVVVP